MCAWTDKVALIINLKYDEEIEILKTLLELGMVVVGFVTSDVFDRFSKLLENAYPSEFGDWIKLYKCDLSNIKDINATFTIIKEVHGGVDVLINNACYNLDSSLVSGELGTSKKIIDVNINAVVACTRLSIECMIERETRGHIIFLDLYREEDFNNSLSTVLFTCNAAVKSVNEILRHEFRYLKANIKTTYVTLEEKQTRSAIIKLNDISQIIKTILDTPEHLHVHEIILDGSFI